MTMTMCMQVNYDNDNLQFARLKQLTVEDLTSCSESPLDFLALNHYGTGTTHPSEE